MYKIKDYTGITYSDLSALNTSMITNHREDTDPHKYKPESSNTIGITALHKFRFKQDLFCFLDHILRLFMFDGCYNL